MVHGGRGMGWDHVYGADGCGMNCTVVGGRYHRSNSLEPSRISFVVLFHGSCLDRPSGPIKPLGMLQDCVSSALARTERDARSLFVRRCDGSCSWWWGGGVSVCHLGRSKREEKAWRGPGRRRREGEAGPSGHARDDLRCAALRCPLRLFTGVDGDDLTAPPSCSHNLITRGKQLTRAPEVHDRYGGSSYFTRERWSMPRPALM
ncbi:uncharacterized protein BO95DRAFT_65 [Aspergillus brunneoviolaceus CBS 621.78]|uniref:Uncharacterized protein n=1 Tax=Aspergillus brunneoviolaceus CBS 621.78 TaxID=1450534 RepID=A0ACD1GPX7_9EURO|nr:hypothetical protein BO95DRAFT_65 [Aspergillus brunneoviolaceus CBS 621.78]RAH51308.1 hypothetical protein BO95DRAFT_65 [Aspergillus brunneoviolaceus CBS 621.78]